MSSPLTRKLTLCQALNFILLLVAPVCLSSPQSSWISTWGPSGESSSGRVRRQLHFRNEWATWSGWSVCSRSCGSGASVRTRTCITRNPVGGPCAGDPRQYKICNTK
ncbi:A disintegrin and metalloproteinase with thrombospondin motifs adt-2, partial [Larimichthys crocea]